MRLRRAPAGSAEDPPAGEAGLSLLEVLFAVAILGMGIAIIAQGLALGLRVRRESVELRKMTLVASGVLNRLLLHGEAPAAEESGEEGRYTWRLVPGPAGVDGEGNETGLIPVSVVVERPAGRPLEVVTLFPGEESP